MKLWKAFYLPLIWTALGFVILQNDEDPSKLQYGLLWICYLVELTTRKIVEYLESEEVDDLDFQ